MRKIKKVKLPKDFYCTVNSEKAHQYIPVEGFVNISPGGDYAGLWSVTKLICQFCGNIKSL